MGRFTNGLATVALTVATLYFGRAILMPLAIACLLAFLLSPLVRLLERWRMARVVAVLISVTAVFAVIALVGAIFAWQLQDFAVRLPEYRANLQSKVQQLRFSGKTWEKIQETLSELNKDVDQEVEGQPVRIVSDRAVPLEQVQSWVGGLAASAASGALVVMLVIFMLISREDLRNRLVRLTGKKLAVTTHTVDEIATRISRYLVLNAIVNGGFGIAVGAGLAAIGVKYPLMWGLLAVFWRFIPYLGAVMAAAPPVVMALMQFPGNDWLHPLLAAGLFVVLEFVTNSVVEPLVYGHGTGVSTVALLVSAMFWIWIWGPIGLALAVPLTVIVVVIGERVSSLEPLAILLGDVPPVAPHVLYYQRLLAGDTEEAIAILKAHIHRSSLAAAYDEIVIPALVLAERDCERGEVSEDARESLWQSTRGFLDGVAGAQTTAVTVDETLSIEKQPILHAHVVGCPAHDAADETSLCMLRATLTIGGKARFDVLAVKMLVSEMLAAIEVAAPDVVLISTLGPRGGRQARYLCKRLRQNFPKLRLIVAQWGFRGNRRKLSSRLRAQGADRFVTTMAEANDALRRVQPVDGTAERIPPAEPIAPVPVPASA
jgi:predicted PurR-regulated permease PerM